MRAPFVSHLESGGLARLTFERPDAGNAITPVFIADLDAAVSAIAGSGAKAVLLSSGGPNFCVGADLKHFASRSDRIATELDDMAKAFHAVLLRLVALPVPIIARVQGAAVGAGLGFVLIADHVVCAESTRFSTGYIKLGLSADAGVSLNLAQALGPRLARNLLMTGRVVRGPEAVAIGLADLCCAESALAAESEAAARRFADGPGPAYAAIKRLTGEAARGPAMATHLDREREEIVGLAENERLARALETMAESRGSDQSQISTGSATSLSLGS